VNGPLSFEENYSPISSSSRTSGDRKQPIGFMPRCTD
jgi:hypothetical protein